MSDIVYLCTATAVMKNLDVNWLWGLVGVLAFIVVYIITFNEPVDYMARAVMILMQGKDITRAIGRVDDGPSYVFAPYHNHKGQAPYKKTGSLVFLCK